ncbi:hypothetical protein [Eubacterium callanderi]|uniref:hypothetical protein n=1 Tax=Eubacterium callanderi TaxID=53442 RepID=UPI0026730C5D|nr:hypothetical protein [Eubacterium callanderi]
MDLQFDRLSAEDIECRIAMVKQNGLSLLLYKDARCDMRLLDKTVGPMNWQRKHEFKDGRLYCAVGIWDDDKEQWIWKEDVGTESNTEKEKGQASDSFKRACFNWGIGRELYTAPFIWINAQKASIRQNGQRYVCSDKFIVSKMDVENGVISDLVITKESKEGGGGVVYRMRPDTAQQERTQSADKAEQAFADTTEAPAQGISDKQLRRLFAIADEHNVSKNQLKITCMAHFKKEHLKDMTKPEYDKLVSVVERAPKTGGKA